MRSRAHAALLAPVAATLALTGCNSVSPCTRLAPPTPQELAVVQAGAEVEREIEGAECDLVDGGWTEEPAE
jgi:predicted component of type VI protein secretion system